VPRRSVRLRREGGCRCVGGNRRCGVRGRDTRVSVVGPASERRDDRRRAPEEHKAGAEGQGSDPLGRQDRDAPSGGDDLDPNLWVRCPGVMGNAGHLREGCVRNEGCQLAKRPRGPDVAPGGHHGHRHRAVGNLRNESASWIQSTNDTSSAAWTAGSQSMGIAGSACWLAW
jgi:hypothetical protein